MKGKIQYVGLDRPMEDVMGAAPTSSAWKADVLAGKLYIHIIHVIGCLAYQQPVGCSHYLSSTSYLLYSRLRQFLFGGSIILNNNLATNCYRGLFCRLDAKPISSHFHTRQGILRLDAIFVANSVPYRLWFAFSKPINLTILRKIVTPFFPIGGPLLFYNSG